MSLTTLVRTGASSNRVDIVFMGDGYTGAEAGTFLGHVNGFVEYLFSDLPLTDPFHAYRNFFNIHMITTPSNDSGVDDPSAGISRDTALGATYRYDGVTERLLYVNTPVASSALQAALDGTDIDPEMRLVTTNSSKYGGGGGYFAVYAGGNNSAYEIALHEIGHSFAGLADEYTYGGSSVYSGAEPRAPNATKDPSGSKWAHWLGYQDPILGTVGAFEGASYSAQGVYRPTQNSKMRALNKPFDPIAKEAFVLEFYAHVDPLDDWLGRDGTMSLVDPLTLWVAPIDADVIDLEWTVNGTVVAGDMLTFTVNDHLTELGAHTVTARAYDATGLVRRDVGRTEQFLTWTVTVTVQEPVVLSGGAGRDSLIGTALAELLTGLGGDDYFETHGGGDTVSGGAGIDHISYAWSTAPVTLNLTTGHGDIAGASVSDRIWGIEIAEGTEGNDVLHGSAAREDLVGLGGDDVITNEGGDDRMTGGAGEDRLYGATGHETMLGGFGDDEAHGRNGNDILQGGAGNDRLFGGSGEDRMNGGAGDDVLRGGLGDDGMNGSDGHDRLYGGEGHDTLSGENGNDTLSGHGGNDELRGGAGADALSGGAGDDLLHGGPGADWLFGGAGNDRLVGGRFEGIGDGAPDVFVFAPTRAGGGGRDRILDFENGRDLIDLGAFAFHDFASQIVPLGRDTADGLELDFGGGDRLVVAGVSLATFDATDLVL